MKIAILSRSPQIYSTRRLVEAAEKLGHEVMIIDHTKCHYPYRHLARHFHRVYLLWH